MFGHYQLDKASTFKWPATAGKSLRSDTIEAHIGGLRRVLHDINRLGDLDDLIKAMVSRKVFPQLNRYRSRKKTGLSRTSGPGSVSGQSNNQQRIEERQSMVGSVFAEGLPRVPNAYLPPTSNTEIGLGKYKGNLTGYTPPSASIASSVFLSQSL